MKKILSLIILLFVLASINISAQRLTIQDFVEVQASENYIVLESGSCKPLTILEIIKIFAEIEATVPNSKIEIKELLYNTIVEIKLTEDRNE